MTETATALHSPAWFLAYFDPIPEDKWIVGQFADEDDPTCCCARGHLRRKQVGILDKAPYEDYGIITHGTAADDALVRLFTKYGLSLERINDGVDLDTAWNVERDCATYSDSVKARVIYALKQIGYFETHPPSKVA